MDQELRIYRFTIIYRCHSDIDVEKAFRFLRLQSVHHSDKFKCHWTCPKQLFLSMDPLALSINTYFRFYPGYRDSSTSNKSKKNILVIFNVLSHLALFMYRSIIFLSGNFLQVK